MTARTAQELLDLIDQPGSNISLGKSTIDRGVLRDIVDSIPTIGGGGQVVGRAHINATNLGIANTSIPYDNSAPQSTEGGSAMLLAYTPVDGSGVNTLRIETVVWLGAPAISVAGDVMSIAIFDDGVANALAAVGHEVLVSGGQNFVLPLVVEIPNHTLSGLQVFSVRFGMDPNRAGTVFNGDKGNAFRYGGTGTPKSSLTVTEFSP